MIEKVGQELVEGMCQLTAHLPVVTRWAPDSDSNHMLAFRESYSLCPDSVSFPRLASVSVLV